ncbi:MAG TPA: Ig-like domain-containing protein, partial [Nitrososphaerales archaeon]|nr:Ig-like domain-containing protein [Nitrososphaerales archaeon]
GQCGAYQIGLKLVPGVLPTDGQTYSMLEVSLETQSGSPAISSTDTIVQLTSDKSEVASVPTLATIPAGSISTLAAVTTSALAGTANVTATSTGLVPKTIAIKTIIPAPSQLAAYIAPPSSAYSVNGNYPILVVQLQDSSGNPARARQSTGITVTSSNGSLLSSFVSLSIPVGKDYVMSFLHTKGDGVSTLTVTSQGLASSTTTLTSYPSPLVIKLALVSTTNSFIFANQTATFQLTMSYLGQPLKDVNVTWTASRGTVTPGVTSTGSSGVTSTVFVPASYGAYNITASSSTSVTGAIIASYSLTVAQVPPKAPPSLIAQFLGYWYYIVAVVAVVIVALVYLLRMRRKKQRAEIEAGFEVV